MPDTIPDLTSFAVGGVTVPVAAYVVLQALKRSYPGLRRHMPAVVMGLACVIVALFLWSRLAFVWLSGSIVTAALILSAHGAAKTLTQKNER